MFCCSLPCLFFLSFTLLDAHAQFLIYCNVYNSCDSQCHLSGLLKGSWNIWNKCNLLKIVWKDYSWYKEGLTMTTQTSTRLYLAELLQLEQESHCCLSLDKNKYMYLMSTRQNLWNNKPWVMHKKEDDTLVCGLETGASEEVVCIFNS